MAVEYNWDSKQSMNDIITALQDITDKKNFDPWSFKYSHIEISSCKFSLVYDNYLPRDMTYRKSHLKGIMYETQNGCTINARVHFAWLNVFTWPLFLFILMPVFAVFADFEGRFTIAIMVSLIGFVCLFWHLYTYKESKEEKTHIDIITSIAEIEPSVYR